MPSSREPAVFRGAGLADVADAEDVAVKIVQAARDHDAPLVHQVAAHLLDVEVGTLAHGRNQGRGIGLVGEELKAEALQPGTDHLRSIDELPVVRLEAHGCDLAQAGQGGHNVVGREGRGSWVPATPPRGIVPPDAQVQVPAMMAVSRRARSGPRRAG